MTNDGIKITAEHLYEHDRKGAGVVSCGYDKAHRHAIGKMHKQLLFSSPEKPITVILGQDEECEECPVNPASPRYNPKLIKRKRIKVCNSGDSENIGHDQRELNELERLYGKSYEEFTAGDFQKHVRR